MDTLIHLDIPQEVGHVTRLDAEGLRRELAVHLFSERLLSFGKARELAHMTIWAFQQLLGSRGIAAHYDEQDLQQDLATARRLS
jgi:predicted HTH domain antitoxin